MRVAASIIMDDAARVRVAILALAVQPNVLQLFSGTRSVFQAVGGTMREQFLKSRLLQKCKTLAEGDSFRAERNVCLSCEREYRAPLKTCPHDNTLLVPLAHDQLLGTLLDNKYRLVSVIGTGASSVVYKALHESMNRVVAIKVLNQGWGPDSAAKVKRFQHEGRIACSLDHPNIIAIHDFGTSEGGQPYLVMDYLGGDSLADLIEQQGHLPFEQAVPIFRQVCDAIGYAHSKGVIHRDIKPSNIILANNDDRKGLVKIVDFGIAKLMEWAERESLAENLSGHCFGSPLYMSPEQCMSEPVDTRADVYSFGASLYHALIGMPPVTGRSVAEVVNGHLNLVPPRFNFVRSDVYVPDRLESVVFKALEKDRSLRQQSMTELDLDLAAVMSSRGSSDACRQVLKVMLVDDSPLLIYALQAALRSAHDLEIVGTARDGEEAVKKALELTPDMILMDIEMPRLNGIDATKRIKAKLPDTRVLMLTSHGDNACIFAAFSAGANGYCLKKWSRGHLESAIRMVAQGGAWLDPEISSAVLRVFVHTADDPLTGLTLKCSEMDEAEHGAADISFLLSLAHLRESENKDDEAEAIYRGALTVLRRYGTAPSALIAYVLSNLADLLFRQRKLAQAEPLYLEALEIRHKLLGPEHLDVAASLEKLGNLFDLQEGYEEAEKFYRWSLSIREKASVEADPVTVETCHKLAWVYRAQKKYTEAEQIEAQAREVQEKLSQTQ